MPNAVLQVVLSYVEMVNQADNSGLTGLLSSRHTMVDVGGVTRDGPHLIAKAWQKYLTDFPVYHIYIRNIYQRENSVILIGHTTGSHLNAPDVVEFHSQGVIWDAKVCESKITRWQIMADTQENYDRLTLDKYQEVFHPSHFAATIAKHLDLLPSGARTHDMRDVRKFYSRLYKDATPEDLLGLAEHLLFQEGYRFVPYELIFHHSGAIQALSPERVIALGKGINDWSSADSFAHFIAGPAWMQGILTDAHIDRWIASEDIWWRRAAVVSTIYLDGDVERMLRYTKSLLDDQEDLIIKALSWVLRSAIEHDRQAVITFLETYKDRLAGRIKREVGNKLETGLKSP